MSTHQSPAADPSLVFDTTVNNQIDSLIDHAKTVWKSKADDAKQHVESIMKYQERIKAHQKALDTSIASAEEVEANLLELLVKTYGAERILPKWEAAGDLAPPGFRRELRHLNAVPPLRAPAPSLHGPGSDEETLRAESPGRSVEKPDESTVHVCTAPPPLKRLLSGDSEEIIYVTHPAHKRIRKSRGEEVSQTATEPASLPRGRRKLALSDVEGKHWAFAYPWLGPGYFVLLCNDNVAAAHRFDDDPLRITRAIRHFAAHSLGCHRDVRGLPCKLSERELVQRFAYQGKFPSQATGAISSQARVLTISKTLVEGMTAEACVDSNRRIEEARVRIPHRANSRRKDGRVSHPTSSSPATEPARPLAGPDRKPVIKAGDSSEEGLAAGAVSLPDLRVESTQ